MESERSEYLKKQFYSIGEVAEIVGTNESTLRFWEREFKEIKPRRASRGVRYYSNSDLEIVRLIHYLVKEKGLTLDGAKKRLKENTSKESNTMEVVNKLKDIRAELMSIRNYIAILETEERERSEMKNKKTETLQYSEEVEVQYSVAEEPIAEEDFLEDGNSENSTNEPPLLSLF